MLGLIEETELVNRDEEVYRDRDKLPSKDRYWAQLEDVRSRRPAYQQMIEQAKLEGDIRRLAISESRSEIGALVLKILSTWLAPRSS